jgi:hypothetical protein
MSAPTIPEFISECKYDNIFMNKNTMVLYALSIKPKEFDDDCLRYIYLFPMHSIRIDWVPM